MDFPVPPNVGPSPFPPFPSVAHLPVPLPFLLPLPVYLSSPHMSMASRPPSANAMAIACAPPSRHFCLVVILAFSLWQVGHYSVYLLSSSTSMLAKVVITMDKRPVQRESLSSPPPSDCHAFAAFHHVASVLFTWFPDDDEDSPIDQRSPPTGRPGNALLCLSWSVFWGLISGGPSKPRWVSPFLPRPLTDFVAYLGKVNI